MREKIKSHMGKWFVKTRDVLCDESGMGVIEIILIIVVLIGLVIIFKSQITSLVNNILSKITTQANSI